MKQEHWDWVNAAIFFALVAGLALALGATGDDCGVVILRELVC